MHLQNKMIQNSLFHGIVKKRIASEVTPEMGFLRISRNTTVKVKKEGIPRKQNICMT